MPLGSSARHVLLSGSLAPSFHSSTVRLDSTMPTSLLLGTRNPGKVKEITNILEDSGWSFCSLQEFQQVESAEENEATYSENAIAKACFYATATGLWALADDSGLEVKALEGAPGVFSARYAGENASDADRRELLLSELAKV